MTIPWVAVEDAIHTWIDVASGLDAAQIIHRGQGGSRPADITGTWIEISVPSLKKTGFDSEKVEDADVPSAGAEIKITTGGPRWGVLRMTCYAGEATSATATGVASPMAILDDVVLAGGTELRRAVLDSVGLAILSVGTIQSIDGVLGSALLEPRATVDFQISVASNVVDLTTYINTAELKSTAPGHTDLGIDTVTDPVVP